MVDVPVPPVVEEVVPVVQEEDKLVNARVPQVLEETAEVKWVSQERVQQLTAERAPMPQFLTETVEVVRLVPQEQVQQRIDEQMVEVLVPQVMEVNVDVIDEHIVEVPQERDQERIAEIGYPSAPDVGNRGSFIGHVT